MSKSRYDIWEVQATIIFLEQIYQLLTHFGKEMNTDSMDTFLTPEDRKLMDDLSAMYRRLNNKLGDLLDEYDSYIADAYMDEE